MTAAKPPAASFCFRAALMILIAAAAFLAIDQGSKAYVLKELGFFEACPPGGMCRAAPVDVWPPYLRFVMGWNPGINFGLFGAGSDLLRYGLIAFAGLVGAAVLWHGARRGGILTILGAGMLIGGAVGNAVDRIIYGYVADFLNMSCCGYTNPYVFNLADVFIFAGLGALALAPEKKFE